MAMWSAIELNIAIICACLMVMKPLVSRLFPRLFSESSEAPIDRSSYIQPPTISSDRVRTKRSPLSTESTTTEARQPAGIAIGVTVSMDDMPPRRNDPELGLYPALQTSEIDVPHHSR